MNEVCINGNICRGLPHPSYQFRGCTADQPVSDLPNQEMICQNGNVGVGLPHPELQNDGRIEAANLLAGNGGVGCCDPTIAGGQNDCCNCCPEAQGYAGGQNDCCNSCPEAQGYCQNCDEEYDHGGYVDGDGGCCGECGHECCDDGFSNGY